jgi:uncharacterized protein (UPF0216 family)
MTPKDAFRNTLKLRNTDKRVFVPFLYGLAAKVTQLPLKEIVYDPSYYAHSLEATHKLFQLDVIVNCYDPSIEAESCGCRVIWNGDFGGPNLVGEISEIRNLTPEEFLNSGRIPIVLETTKRLAISLGREAAIVAVVSGPCALATTLQQHCALFEAARVKEHISQVGTLIARLVRALSELKVDSIFFREDLIGEGIWGEIEPHQDTYCSIYRTLFNIVKFYNAYPVLVVKNIDLDELKTLCELLKPSGVVVLGKRFNRSDLQSLKELSDSLKISLGLPLSIELDGEKELGEQFEMMESFLRECGPTGFFYTTDGEVRSDIPFETMHDLVRIVRT